MGKRQYNGQLSGGQTGPAQGGNSTNVQQVNITRKEYILVVGFEVNFEHTAFINNVHDLRENYGHAFFYVTKNNVVETFFSFGPAALGVSGKFTDEYNGERSATTNYPVSEVSRLYRFLITKKQSENVKKSADNFTARVSAGKEHYDASQNDTCAETARDILSEGGVATPDGSGPVIGTDNMMLDRITEKLSFVNPYMWNKNFNAKYPTHFIFYPGSGGVGSLRMIDGRGNSVTQNGQRVGLSNNWILAPGDSDPLMSTNQHTINHGSLEKK
ncbi:TPA: hypothetical protein I8271_004816 [Kluyvera intermedia]|uniref:Uncharacterized protein n=2 Tax=Enterobacteriaceae TaxID=543 RepID=A0AAC8TMZ6_9ENTR|nr:hypothetical protein [Phytobacter ursingii]HAT2207191.1 hypothetical protein [Kluyvera intermedia]AKL12263.1 hypothetical protein AB182_13500 [Phytobacter ursingii]HAT2517885.1 hypothetical protein [Kluyvera intermedia]HAT2606047.1 hypothetical protein [Kluyvera intermedia]HAT2682856.1 hypothetical protein [Kluyvera intermedia]